MEIIINRESTLPDRCMGEMFINDVFFAHTLEDTDRGLHSGMIKEEILARKVPRETAIPTGRYEIILSYSNRFKKMLPLIVSVKGFEGVRIHGGNRPEDSEGCPLIGLTRQPKSISNCAPAVSDLIQRLRLAMLTEKSYIEIF